MALPTTDRTRIDWLDHARGICIILVVMLYATELVGDRAGREGWLHAVAHFAKPFRMPDFFVLSGLLFPLAIGRDWRTFLDRKVVHFAYFYILWLTILVGFRALSGGKDSIAYYAMGLWQPYSLLWFIYMLPVFYVVTRATRGLPPWLVWCAAAVLQSIPFETEVKVLEKFVRYFVFFYSGYLFSTHFTRFAGWVAGHRGAALAGLAAWAAVNGALVFGGLATLPGVSLALALAGAAAVIAVAVLAARIPAAGFLGYCGALSIVIYLGFFIPMTLVRKALAVSGLVGDVGLTSAIATVAGIAGALALHRVVRGTRLAFLFERPRWAHMSERKPVAVPLEDAAASHPGP